MSDLQAFDEDEIEPGSIAVAILQPGDIILFRCPMALRQADRDRVAKMLNDVFKGHESIILDAGQDIAILRPEDK